MEFREQVVPGYERVIWGRDDAAGYHGVIAIHSSTLGPAVGGTRYWQYANENQALTDALRLARGMTYKNALAQLPWGGGKSVIMRNLAGEHDRQPLFRAHGKLVEKLAGKYITGEDVGTSPADMEFIRMETSHVAGLKERAGDPSPHTARGVFRAMQAAAKVRWGSEGLAGKTIAVQGCGNVGYHLALELHRAGARLVVSDIEPQRVQRLVTGCGARAEAPENIHSVPADVFAPCALGGILNDQTIPQLRSEIVCGGANNQLLESRHGDALEQRRILYVPDYAANAGGVIYGYCIEQAGWNQARTRERLDSTIHETVLRIFSIAGEQRIPSWQAADRLAEERLLLPRAGSTAH